MEEITIKNIIVGEEKKCLEIAFAGIGSFSFKFVFFEPLFARVNIRYTIDASPKINIAPSIAK